MTKRNIITLVVILATSVYGGLAITQVVHAQGRCAGVDTMIVSCDGEGGDAAIHIIGQVINILMAGVGIMAVGAVIYGAILYGTSGDKPDNMKKAKEIWVNTVLGLVLFAFIVAITNFLVPGGIF
ncbi:hypothetical protein EOM60_01290 [Candidatus Saccharibacteria bacterium]|nr:hypothetical protein [Candidatus Saccharibacteria bacterium]